MKRRELLVGAIATVAQAQKQDAKLHPADRRVGQGLV